MRLLQPWCRHVARASRQASTSLGPRAGRPVPAPRALSTSQPRYLAPKVAAVLQLVVRSAWARLPQEKRDRIRRALPLWLGAAGLVGVGVCVTKLEEVPATGRVRLMLTSRESEVQLGKEAADSVREHYCERMLSTSHPEVLRVASILWRLVHRLDPAEEAKDGFMLRHPWSLHVINDPTKNAFVVPGGYVFVFTGMIEQLRSDGELASVLGHEMAHVLARHSAEGLSWDWIFGFVQLALLGLTVMLLPVEWDLGRWANEALAAAQYHFTNVTMSLPFSRRKESEADYIGQRLAARACFNPREAAAVWEGLQAAGVENGPAWLSTHPPHEDRRRQLEDWAPGAEAIWEQARCREYLRWLEQAGDKAVEQPNEFPENVATIRLFDPEEWRQLQASAAAAQREPAALAGVAVAAFQSSPVRSHVGAHVGPEFSPWARKRQ